MQFTILTKIQKNENKAAANNRKKGVNPAKKGVKNNLLMTFH